MPDEKHSAHTYFKRAQLDTDESLYEVSRQCRPGMGVADPCRPEDEALQPD